MAIRKWLVFVLVLGSMIGAAAAQSADVAKPTLAPAQKVQTKEPFSWDAAIGLVCATGASQSAVATKPTVQCGGSLRIFFLQLEAGVMGSQASQSEVSGYVSTDAWIPLHFFKKPNQSELLLYGVGGYTRMFETGHALDYGVGYGIPLDSNHALSFEARDYWKFANPHQHNVVLRVSWTIGAPIQD